MAKSAKKKANFILQNIGIALVSLIIAISIWQIPLTRNAELKVDDYLMEKRGALDVSASPIVMVALSDEADREIPEKFPWPTSIYAKLVENLNQAGAKVIAFDVIFDQDDIYDLKNDTLFAEAIQKYGNVILSGDVERIETVQSEAFARVFPKRLLEGADPNKTAFVQVLPFDDGEVRTYNIGRRVDGEPYFMLAFEVLKLFKQIPDSNIDELSIQSELEPFKFGDYKVERNLNNSFMINYYGGVGTFPVYSLESVIDDEEYETVSEREAFEVNEFSDPDYGLLHQDVFKDKIVIVGSTMPLLKDFYSTPFARGTAQRPGYEIHAHALQTVLDSNYLSRTNPIIVITLIFVLCFIIVFTNSILGARIGFLLAFIGLGLFVVFVLFSFSNFNLLTFAFAPPLAIIISQFASVSYNYFQEQIEKKRIQGMFSTYVSPELVNRMIASGEEPKLEGNETFMTAFFSDIESFSSFSEQLEPTKLVTLINEYLNGMTQILNNEGGTLDKYIGDAIVAFFGAPVAISNHAFKACVSAVLMQKKLEDLRQKWSSENWPEIVGNMKMRIGLNTGNMVTGNMGSKLRFNYTMMGDNVNLAARCESGAKFYGVYIMVTEFTKEESEKHGDVIAFRYLDNIVVKGRESAVKVYEIVGFQSELSDSQKLCIEKYELGMQEYLNQNWDAAIKCFEEAASLEQHKQNPSLVLMKRCNEFKKEINLENWNGVYVMVEK